MTAERGTSPGWQSEPELLIPLFGAALVGSARD
jgi:hypothetical protein